MTRRNNQTNTLIKRLVIVGDILLLCGLLLLFRWQHPAMSQWSNHTTETFWVVCIMAMLLAQWKFSTIIHLRLISGGDILRRVFELSTTQTIVAYLVMKVVDSSMPVGWLLVQIGLCQMLMLTVVRLIERSAIKRFRRAGMNTRTVTFIGADPVLLTLYDKLNNNPTLGYLVMGYYADSNISESQKGSGSLSRKGTLQELMAELKAGKTLDLGDEVYVCLPRNERQKLKELSDYCDSHVIHFYYIPATEERLDLNLKREFLDDLEVFTTHEVPLENFANRMVKRAFDITYSIFTLLLCLPLLPFIALIIKWQSPGPIFFRQQRTGINGKVFMCYKFRSMHTNIDADKLQATKDDPRKFAFGSFMRKYNIDELPQFWNVLKGTMSIVGPRPHMLLHTETYSQQIGTYMVRHFVKPGITGWAQVTGFRGETKELWQMEERVKRDIWYIENWSIWLDLRIVWMTLKSMFIHDKQAY
ncbi:MAG: undecaprenyl-phosphate glucose phosphotransferase [Prevotella sp.]|nr:undecaprenyl-phosphate glucose phosphotransferase [Prevotella sp.]